MATRIGVDKFTYAVMKTEETATTDPVYDAPVSAPGLMSININPNPSVETLFADNGPMETASTLGKIEVEIQKNALTTEDKATLLGHQIMEDGTMVYGDSDIPPYVAIGFRTLKSNGKYRYVWLLKGLFSDPEDANETKGDSISFQSDTINGQFVRLNKEYIPVAGGKATRPWKTEIDEEYADANSATITSWFTKPKLPTTGA